MRAIDADRLKEHIDKLPALQDGNFAGNHSALKALINMQPSVEPEKCGDCVSREAVAYMLDTMEMSVDETWIDLYRKALSGLVALQSVTPERPHGYWIWNKRTGDYECSECGSYPLYEEAILDADEIDKYRYCRWCGAKMEVQNGKENS